ncbi:hypothetical protein PENTCL1PPCAC_26526 [Pristionchus entomophagus]|uniref:SH3 domain-containing protein n=1 Tax=Pristionchus entomophagus TaxID=358040 RepID=A0AAV5UCU3_9BILA|nr:hypothetical protein PENTCL1PPCAC_26526 [Pristionchus entomophagus]
MLRASTILLLCALAILSFGATPQAVVKSKLCANDPCTDALFVSTIERPQNYPDLLNLEAGQSVEILAIKFSDRPDMFEARANGVTGRIYGSSIKLEDYVNFLKFSIVGKKEYKSVAQEPKIGSNSVLGVVKSDQDLVRDYNVKAQALASMTGVEQEMMEIPPPPQKGHGHSHSHGHAHDHGHGHSHDGVDGHGHSHSAPETPKVEEVKVEAVTAVPPIEEVKNEVPLSSVPHVEANPATDEPKKELTEEEIEAEMQRLIEEDMKKLAEGTIEENAADASPTIAPAAAAAEEPVAATIETPLPVVDLPTTTVSPPVEETTSLPVVVEEPVVVTTPPPIPPTPPLPTPIDDLPPLPVSTTVSPPPAEVTEPPKTAATEPVEYCYGKDECPPGSIPPPTTDSPSSPPPLDPIPSSTPSPYEMPHPSDPSPPSPPSDPSPPSTTIDPFADLPPLPNHSNFGRTTRETVGGSTCNYQSSIISSTLRSGLPVVFGGMTDGSIGLWINVTLVLGAMVIVMVSKLICEGGDGMEYDRAAAHNLSTALKACQAQLAVKEAEAATPRIEPSILQKAEMADNQAHQIRQLEMQLQHAMGDLERKTVEADEANRKVESSREVIANAEMRASGAENELRKKEEEVKELRGVREKMNEKVEMAKMEEKKERKTREGMEEEMDRLKKRVIEVEGELEEAEKREREIIGEKKRLESEVSEMAKLMEDMEKNGVEKSSEKSGENENGWEDDTWSKDVEEKQTGEGSSANGSWSHGEEEESERNLPARESTSASSGNIREMVKLRARTAQLESENETLRESSDREKSERCRLEKERSSLSIEIEKLKKGVMEKEKEKKEATDRHNESHSSLISILKGVETRNDKLSEEVTRVQSELKSLEEEKRSAVDKLRDVESELKRLRNDYGHLETRHFNQTKELKKELQTARDQLASSSMGPLRSDTLNMSATSSLDDRGSLGLESHSHWDEPSEAEIQTAVHSTRRTPSSELLGSSHSRRSIRSRRSDRFMPDSGSPLDSGSGGEQRGVAMSMSREGRDGRGGEGPVRVDPQRRMRSRSHGRTPTQRSSYLNQAPPLYMDYQQPMYGLDAMARRHSRSGQQLYYSSGGSNGGRSPPPEMPLLPAMPPPGVRKPSSKRATGALPPQ